MLVLRNYFISRLARWNAYQHLLNFSNASDLSTLAYSLSITLTLLTYLTFAVAG